MMEEELSEVVSLSMEYYHQHAFIEVVTELNDEVIVEVVRQWLARIVSIVLRVPLRAKQVLMQEVALSHDVVATKSESNVHK